MPPSAHPAPKDSTARLEASQLSLVYAMKAFSAPLANQSPEMMLTGVNLVTTALQDLQFKSSVKQAAINTSTIRKRASSALLATTALMAQLTQLFAQQVLSACNSPLTLSHAPSVNTCLTLVLLVIALLVPQESIAVLQVSLHPPAIAMPVTHALSLLTQANHPPVHKADTSANKVTIVPLAPVSSYSVPQEKLVQTRV